MSDRSAILRAFLLGAPMEAIALLTGQDAEAAIRAELLALAQGHDQELPAQPAARKPRQMLKPKAAMQKQAAPCRRQQEPDGEQTFADLLLSTIASLGEPTLAEIHRDLEASEVRKTRDQISGMLTWLRKAGRVERLGDGHAGRWRVVR